MQHHEHVDLVLVKVPTPRQQKTAVVILDQDQQQIPDEGKMNLALNVDLPKVTLVQHCRKITCRKITLTACLCERIHKEISEANLLEGNAMLMVAPLVSLLPAAR